jgi:hypothetical protein
MKTTEIKTVVVEPADIQPLLDKAIAAVGGKSVSDIYVQRVTGNVTTPDGRQNTIGIGLEVKVLVETPVQ